MKYEEAIPEYKNGRKIRRSHWPEGSYYALVDGEMVDESGVVDSFPFIVEDILAENWEFVPEPKKKYQVNIFLWSDGEMTNYPNRIASVFLNPIPTLVEARAIEWEEK